VGDQLLLNNAIMNNSIQAAQITGIGKAAFLNKGIKNLIPPNTRLLGRPFLKETNIFVSTAVHGMD